MKSTATCSKLDTLIVALMLMTFASVIGLLAHMPAAEHGLSPEHAAPLAP